MTSQLQTPRWEIDRKIYVPDESNSFNSTLIIHEPRGSNLTNYKNYQLSLDDASSYYNLSEAKLHVRFHVRQAVIPSPASDLTYNNKVVLQDAYSLFSRMKLTVNGITHEIVDNPGRIHFYESIAKYSDDYLPVASKACFYPVMKHDNYGNHFSTVRLVEQGNSYYDGETDIARLPGGFAPTSVYKGKIAHNAAAPGSPAEGWHYQIITDGNMVVGFNSLAVVKGDFVYYNGAAWVKIAKATRALPFNAATLGSGWATHWYPVGSHTSPVQYRSYALYDDDSADDQDDIDLTATDGSTTRANPSFEDDFENGIQRIIGETTAILPLREIFGMFQTLGSRNLKGNSIQIDLTKNDDPASILYSNGVMASNTVLQVDILDLQLHLPRLLPALKIKKNLNNMMMQLQERGPTVFHSIARTCTVYKNIPNTITNNRLSIALESNRPLYVIAAFSLASKRTNVKENPFQCAKDDVNLSTIKLIHNKREYPKSQYNDTDDMRILRDLQEIFAKQTTLDNGNDALSILKESHQDCHYLVGFDLSKSTPEDYEKFKASEVTIDYTLKSSPTGSYDVTLIIASRTQYSVTAVGEKSLIV